MSQEPVTLRRLRGLAGVRWVLGVLGVTMGSLLHGGALANDFPTQARVEFVLGCMNEQGGQSYDSLYKCVCLVDAIAAEMSHDEFAEAQVFSQLRSTAGERGGVFRDPDQAQALVAKLAAAIERGKARCFLPK
jgi:hypothetical protein